MHEHEQQVRGLLAAAGISPHEDEVEALVEKYAAYRSLAEGQYRVAESVEAAPELILDLGRGQPPAA